MLERSLRDLTPSVMTGGCSSSSSLSGICPAFRFDEPLLNLEPVGVGDQPEAADFESSHD